METRLYGADGNLEQRRQFFEREIVEEKQRENLALMDGKLVEAMAELLSVFQGSDVVAAAIVCQLLGITFDFGRLDAKAADRGVACSRVEVSGKRARIAEFVERAEELEPRFLEKLPGVGFRWGDPAEIEEQGPFPELHDFGERFAVAALPADDEQGRLDELLVGGQRAACGRKAWLV